MKKLFFLTILILFIQDIYSQILYSIKVNGNYKEIILFTKGEIIPKDAISKKKIRSDDNEDVKDYSFQAQMDVLVNEAFKVDANIIQLKEFNKSPKNEYLLRGKAFYINNFNAYKESLINSGIIKRCKGQTFSYVNIFCTPIRVQFSKYNYKIKINDISYYIKKDTILSIKIEKEGYVNIDVDEPSAYEKFYVKPGKEYYVECLGIYNLPNSGGYSPNSVNFVIPDKHKSSILLNYIHNEVEGEIKFKQFKEMHKL